MFGRQDFFPVEPQRIAADDRGRFLQRQAHEILAEGFREPNVHLVVHQPHRHFGDSRRPFADLDAVEGVHVDERKMLDVEFPLRAGVEQLEDFDFQQSQFAIGDDEEVAAAARRVEEAELRELLVEAPQFGFVALDALEFGAQIVEEK